MPRKKQVLVKGWHRAIPVCIAERLARAWHSDDARALIGLFCIAFVVCLIYIRGGLEGGPLPLLDVQARTRLFVVGYLVHHDGLGRVVAEGLGHDPVLRRIKHATGGGKNVLKTA